MNEILEIKDPLKEELTNLYNEYYTLTVQAHKYDLEYKSRFSNLIIARFKAMMKVAEFKRRLAIVIEAINNDKSIAENDIDEAINDFLEEYYEELELLREYKNFEGEYVSKEIRNECKKIFYSITKLIHPDIHPDINVDYATSLLSKAKSDYMDFLLDDLKIDYDNAVALSASINNDIKIDDIEDRIVEIREKINDIISTEPYNYRYILDDPLKIKEKNMQFQKEIDDFLLYANDLEKEYRRLLNSVNKDVM